MTDFETVAREALLLAGNVIQRERISHHEIKGGNIRDIVTSADRKADAIIRDTISRHFPSHAIISEESPPKQGAEYTWHADPIDGTLNFGRQNPYYCISLALACGNEVIMGMVYAPTLKEFYTAAKGKGAYMNGEQLLTSRIENLERAMLATDFGYNDDHRKFVQNFLERTCLKTNSVRMKGSAVLQLCELAKGSIDCYIYPGSTTWDFAATSLIVREAGGTITNFEGKNWQLDSKNVIAAANTALHKKLYEEVHAIRH